MKAPVTPKHYFGDIYLRAFEAGQQYPGASLPSIEWATQRLQGIVEQYLHENPANQDVIQYTVRSAPMTDMAALRGALVDGDARGEWLVRLSATRVAYAGLYAGLNPMSQIR